MQRVPARVRYPLLGDQVHVLDHDDRRLQRPRHRAGLPDHPQRVPGQHHDRGLRHVAHQVADRVRLAGARGAVQQHAALEVLPAGPQPARVLLHAEHLPFDPVQQIWRQHHVVAADPRAVEEAQQRAPAVPEHVAAVGDHLAAVDVALDGELADLAQDPLRVLGVPRGHLERDLFHRAALIGTAQQQRVPAIALGDQVQTAPDAGPGLPARAGRQGDGGHVPDAETGVVPARLGQLGQAEHRVLEAGDADQLVLPARPGQPRVQADLHVHVVVLQPGAADRGHAGRSRPEVLVQHVAQRVVLGPGRAHRQPHQPPAEPERVGRLGPPLVVGRPAPAVGRGRSVAEVGLLGRHARSLCGTGISRGAAGRGRQTRWPARTAARRSPRRRAG
jgi:hypothetical protein